MLKCIAQLVLLLLISTGFAAAQTQTIPPGSTVYIAADNGFDTYLSAALVKKKVPLVVVDDRSKAQYEIEAGSNYHDPGLVRGLLLGQTDTTDTADMRMIDLKSSAVVFAYTVKKTNSYGGQQSTAEACAKHLKSIVR